MPAVCRSLAAAAATSASAILCSSVAISSRFAAAPPPRLSPRRGCDRLRLRLFERCLQLAHQLLVGRARAAHLLPQRVRLRRRAELQRFSLRALRPGGARCWRRCPGPLWPLGLWGGRRDQLHASGRRSALGEHRGAPLAARSCHPQTSAIGQRAAAPGIAASRAWSTSSCWVSRFIRRLSRSSDAGLLAKEEPCSRWWCCAASTPRKRPSR